VPFPWLGAAKPTNFNYARIFRQEAKAVVCIPQKNPEQIFLPYFSTKKCGADIGLNIAQQIMQRQKG